MCRIWIIQDSRNKCERNYAKMWVDGMETTNVEYCGRCKGSGQPAARRILSGHMKNETSLC